jgi:signal transduction histidine kinase
LQVRRGIVGLSVFLVAVSFAASSARGDDVHSVLLVFSDNRLLPTNVEIDNAFRETLLGERHERVEIYTEFLDRAHFGSPAYDDALLNLFRVKYSGDRTPTAIVAGGMYAARFMLTNRAAIFAHAPIVFGGLSVEEVQTLQPLPPDVIGVPVAFDYRGTVMEALKLHPNAQRLVMIVGTNAIDRNDLASLESIAGELSGRIKVELLDGLTIDALQTRLRALDPHDVVFTCGFFSDGAGRQFIPRDAAQLIAQASRAPVYGPFTTFLGTGIVGGRMPSWRTVGVDVAHLVSQVFDGIDPAAIAVPKTTPSALQIDWREARRFGITEEQLPPDATVLFKEPTFWEAYGRYAIIAFVVILLQAMLIARLLHERRLQRQTAAALHESRTNLTLAAQTARLTTWVWETRLNALRDAAESPERSPNGDEVSDFDAVLETVHPADREMLARAVHQAVALQRELDVEYRVVKDDAVTWLAARGRADGGSTRLRGVALDITERKSAELEAEQDRNALRHMARVSLLGQLSASIAHQLNQPLAAILGNAEAARTILSRDDLDADELRAICDDIISEDHRASAVIRRLGALFKRTDRVSAPIEINELIVETLDLLRSDLMTRHLTITKALTPELPQVLGDRVQLQQVLMNLVMNACDAMNVVPADQRTLRIRTDAVDREVRVSVSDRGPGIAVENLERIFDPFWSTKPGGMGIGLAVCRSIAAAHGGSLTTLNNEAGGATFRLVLPADPAA